uniref:Multispanning membrane protein n=1 Tax=Solanum tuberosum TaxID=4113 RepID=M1A5C4_SOLTU
METLLVQLHRSLKSASNSSNQGGLSFTFYSMVDVTGKHQGSAETDCSKHKEKCIAYASVVYKEDGSLQDPTHV